MAGEDRDASAGDRADRFEALRAAIRRRDAAAAQRQDGALDRMESEGDRIGASKYRGQAAEDPDRARTARDDAAEDRARRDAKLDAVGGFRLTRGEPEGQQPGPVGRSKVLGLVAVRARADLQGTSVSGSARTCVAASSLALAGRHSVGPSGRDRVVPLAAGASGGRRRSADP